MYTAPSISAEPPAPVKVVSSWSFPALVMSIAGSIAAIYIVEAIRRKKSKPN